MRALAFLALLGRARGSRGSTSGLPASWRDLPLVRRYFGSWRAVLQQGAGDDQGGHARDGGKARRARVARDRRATRQAGPRVPERPVGARSRPPRPRMSVAALTGTGRMTDRYDSRPGYRRTRARCSWPRSRLRSDSAEGARTRGSGGRCAGLARSRRASTSASLGEPRRQAQIPGSSSCTSTRESLARRPHRRAIGARRRAVAGARDRQALGCDAAVVRIVERDGQPLSVGRRTRTIPPALRRALRSRDDGCRFPGCVHRRFLHAHHIHHWARGGPTSACRTWCSCARITTASFMRAGSESSAGGPERCGSVVPMVALIPPAPRCAPAASRPLERAAARSAE